MKKIIIALILILITTSQVFSQLDKDKIFEKMKLQYSKLNSISLSFKLNDNSLVKGDLLAKKGNKYLLTIANRKIYCNGKNIWNYSPENKSVLLSNYTEHGESASIEKIFFEFTKNYKPNKYYKNQSNNTFSSHILELVPIAESSDDITMIKLFINPDELDILSISIYRNYAEENWLISNLKLNPNIADNKFEYKTIDNVELIDLR